MVVEPWFCLIKAATWKSQMKLPPFQSHRGYHRGPLQENTLEAFREAKVLGAKMCECDVQFSRDLVPVIFHDPDLKRIGNQITLTRNLSFAELKTAAMVCSLEEMLNDTAGPDYFNIELKATEINDPLPAAVARVVKECKAEQRVIFSSFNPFALWKLQGLLPDVPRALLVTNAEIKNNKWWLRRMVVAPLLKIHMLNVDQGMLNEEIIAYWKRRKVPLATWTVNDPGRAKEFLSTGISSVISDLNPQAL